MPSLNDSTSMSALSDSTTTMGSPLDTLSPGLFSHDTILPCGRGRGERTRGAGGRVGWGRLAGREGRGARGRAGVRVLGACAHTGDVRVRTRQQAARHRGAGRQRPRCTPRWAPRRHPSSLLAQAGAPLLRPLHPSASARAARAAGAPRPPGSRQRQRSRPAGGATGAAARARRGGAPRARPPRPCRAARAHAAARPGCWGTAPRAGIRPPRADPWDARGCNTAPRAPGRPQWLPLRRPPPCSVLICAHLGHGGGQRGHEDILHAVRHHGRAGGAARAGARDRALRGALHRLAGKRLHCGGPGRAAVYVTGWLQPVLGRCRRGGGGPGKRARPALGGRRAGLTHARPAPQTGAAMGASSP
jgi:hypothetical protein